MSTLTPISKAEFEQMGPKGVWIRLNDLLSEIERLEARLDAIDPPPSENHPSPVCPCLSCREARKMRLWK